MLILGFQEMFFLLWLVNVVNGVASSRGEEFWISSEIQSVQWKDDCLTAATCSSPRFQLTMDLATVNEKLQSNWPAHDEVTGKVLSTHWTHGFPEDVQVSSQVVGTDPEYGFQRNCDTTFTKRVFSMKKTENIPQDMTEVTVKLQARCYNVTLVLKKYTGKCPWCPEEETTRVEMHTSQFLNESNYTTILAVLATVTVISSVLVMVLAFVIYRRSYNYSGNTSTIASSFYSPGRRTMITTISGRPSPPTSFPPSSPSTTTSSNGTVVIQDDSFYDEISDHSTHYEEQQLGVMV